MGKTRRRRERGGENSGCLNKNFNVAPGQINRRGEKREKEREERWWMPKIL